MPWIANLGVADSRTIQPKQYESAKAEREMIISFAPGELKMEDMPTIVKWLHIAGAVVKDSIDEELGKQSATPGAPPKQEPAKPTVGSSVDTTCEQACVSSAEEGREACDTGQG